MGCRDKDRFISDKKLININKNDDDTQNENFLKSVPLPPLRCFSKLMFLALFLMHLICK